VMIDLGLPRALVTALCRVDLSHLKASLVVAAALARPLELLIRPSMRHQVLLLAAQKERGDAAHAVAVAAAAAVTSSSSSGAGSGGSVAAGAIDTNSVDRQHGQGLY
jgi:hypothetical protein